VSPDQEWLPGLTDPVEIGRGGFGVVYKAVETDLNRAVAVKILTGNLDDLALQRFDRERRAMGALSGHPNIVAIYRSGLTGDSRPYLIMEYLPGGSMAERITDRGPLEWRDATDVGIRLCAALETAHRAGVLHRDVKPENVFLSALGAPKLGDFGIARLEGAPQTQSATITASLAHAAPELIDGRPPSVQSDVYGLASTVLTLMTGRPPFSRDTDESIVPLLARIATEPVPDLRALGVPPTLCEVFERAMAKDPGVRFASGAEFGRALQHAQRSLGADVSPLEVQGVDPTVTPGVGAPRAADATVDLTASTAGTAVPAAPAPAPSAPAPAPTPAPAAPSPSAPAPAPAAAVATTTPPGGYAVPPTPSPSYTGPAAPPSRGSGGSGSNVGLIVVLGVVALIVVALLGFLLFRPDDDVATDDDPTGTTAAVDDTTASTSPPTTGEPGVPTTLEPGSTGVDGIIVTSIPFSLGDSPDLDELAAECSAGDLDACDDLASDSPRGTRFDQYGRTCGDRVEQASEPCDDRVDAP
jgi:serine/threonine protein kinase